MDNELSKRTGCMDAVFWALTLVICAACARPTPTPTLSVTPISVPAATPLVTPSLIPTATPEPNLTEADLWQAGFTTLTNKAGTFVIRRGDLILDMSLVADEDGPQIPPSLSPLRICRALAERFDIVSPTTVKVEIDGATGLRVYRVEEGALLDKRTEQSYPAGSGVFAADGNLVPVVVSPPDDVVKWGEQGQQLERLAVIEDDEGSLVWSVAAVAQPPEWVWQEPANPITYSLTSEELDQVTGQTEQERSLRSLLVEDPVDLDSIRQLLKSEDEKMVSVGFNEYPSDSLEIRHIDGTSHLVASVELSERDAARGFEPSFVILYPPSLLEMGPIGFEEVFGDHLNVENPDFVTAFRGTTRGGTEVEIHYREGFHRYLRERIAIEYADDSGASNNDELATLLTHWAARMCDGARPTARDASVMRWAMENEAKRIAGDNLVLGADALRTFPIAWTAEESEKTGLPVFSKIALYVVGIGSPGIGGRLPFESWTLPLRVVGGRELVTSVGSSFGHDKCAANYLALVSQGREGAELHIIYTTCQACDHRFDDVSLSVARGLVNRAIMGLASVCLEAETAVRFQASMRGGKPRYVVFSRSTSVRRLLDSSTEAVTDPRVRDPVGYIVIGNP